MPKDRLLKSNCEAQLVLDICTSKGRHQEGKDYQMSGQGRGFPDVLIEPSVKFSSQISLTRV